MKLGKLFGVSLGPGDPGLVTLKALKILQNADVIFTVISRQGSSSASGRIIDSLDGVDAERIELVFAMRDDREDKALCIRNNAEQIIEKLQSGKSCAFATIGDALTYSTYGYILNELKASLPPLEVETIPGVNSWSALASSVNRVLVEDRAVLSVVPSYAPDVKLSHSADSGNSTVLLKTYNTRDHLINELRSSGVEFLYGANLGMENEFISDNAEDILARDKEYLSMLIVKNKK
jgi:precorrin-2/cobalt-factor-2 C20-methyltransferase